MAEKAPPSLSTQIHYPSCYVDHMYPNKKVTSPHVIASSTPNTKQSTPYIILQQHVSENPSVPKIATG